MPTTIDQVGEKSVSGSGQRSPQYQSRFQEDFELVGLLGRGGFGRVFEARKRIDQKHYAVKRIRLPADENARAKVMREVTVLSALNHNNIVRYFHAWREFPPGGWLETQDASDLAKLVCDSDGYRGGIFEATSLDEAADKATSPPPSFASIFGDVSQSANGTDGSSSAVTSDELTTPKNTLTRNCIKYLYIQMELCRKESLAEWLLDNRRPARDRLYQMYREILQAVAYLHLKGLIHRDLKPPNIFFAVDGTIKVGDLGLVKDMTLSQNESAQNHGLGPTGLARPSKNHTDQIGTRLYMSPEQIASRPYNHKVDVYALGIILFELLADLSTDSERARVIPDLKTWFRFPSNFQALHGVAMEQLLMAMLSVDADKRPEVDDILLHPCIKVRLDSTLTKATIAPMRTNIKSSSLVQRQYYKLLVIGDQNTGKTSIIHRYVHGSFRHRYELTLGAAVHLKQMAWNDSNKLTLEFFDIGGEERSRFMTSAFYRKAVGAFVVTDVTRLDGFQSATLWKKDLDMKLRMHDDSLVPSVLLINKCDEAMDGQVGRELNPAQVDRYCRSQQFSGWFDTSAKDDINIEEAVQFLVGKVLAGQRNQTQVANDDDNNNPAISLTPAADAEKRSHCC